MAAVNQDADVHCPDPPCKKPAVLRNIMAELGYKNNLTQPSPAFTAHVDSLVNAPFAQDTLFPLIGGAPERIGTGGLPARPDTTQPAVLGITSRDRLNPDLQINE